MTAPAPAGGPPVRVALGEYDTGWHSPQESLSVAEALVRDAASCGARVVALPEMTTTGFTMDPAQSVSLSAPPVRALQRLAATHRVWLIAGVALTERQPGGAGERVVNAALAIDPSGDIVAIHRKQRLFAFAGEHDVYTAGDVATVVTMDGLRVGIFICYELRFAELFASVASRCDALVVIANWPAARRPHWDALLRARAIENQCVVVGVNRVGAADGIQYDGGSAAFDAWGDPLPHLACRVPVIEIDPSTVATVRSSYPFLADRATVG